MKIGTADMNGYQVHIIATTSLKLYDHVLEQVQFFEQVKRAILTGVLKCCHDSDSIL